MKRNRSGSSPDNQNFFQNVYEVVKLIPPGRVTTYGAIAAYLGTKGSSRMVGWAMNNSHIEKHIPAHRVVNRNGILTGKHHFSHPEEMQRLLEEEGVIVISDKISDFENVFGTPGRNWRNKCNGIHTL
jgi:methylated-DNA-protein-cysteine methyltransferase related protein